jgi:hypothetical protein
LKTAKIVPLLNKGLNQLAQLNRRVRLKRRNALTQIGGLGGPVVHLDIDIDRVFAIQGRGQALVTYALQIGGLCAVSRMAIT